MGGTVREAHLGGRVGPRARLSARPAARRRRRRRPRCTRNARGASARARLGIGYTRDVRRFATADRYASYNGTAPLEVSSGGRKVHRFSRRGNRQLNHAMHIAAVSQIRQPHSEGRAYYERKLTEGKTGKEALRALKRRVSDLVYRQLLIDATPR